MHITLDYFRSLFDEFDKVPTPKIEIYITVATGRVSRDAWGDTSYQYATALLAAHMIASAGGKGGAGGAVGGAITAESVGELSRSYGTVGQAGTGDDELRTTRYGQEFIAFRRENIIGVMTH
jgi:hypothetical protein